MIWHARRLSPHPPPKKKPQPKPKTTNKQTEENSFTLCFDVFPNSIS